MPRTFVMIALLAASVPGAPALSQVEGVEPAATAAVRELPFDGRWQMSGADTVVETYDGRQVLRMSNGRAIFAGADFQNGTIDFDVELAGVRSFVYLQFRLEDPAEYEEFYLRPHKDMLPDALQYSPVFRGESNWQLFHGPGGTAAAALPAGKWIHVRVVLEGSRAAFFVGDVKAPQMISRLARQPRHGGIALRSFVPQGVTVAHAVRYANVRLSPVIEYAFPETPAEPVATPAGLLTRWELSAPIDQPQGAVLAIPETLAAGPWRTVETEPNGLLILGRHVARPAGSRRSTVLARLALRAARPSLQRLDLGWSDGLTVFVNGEPFFHRDDAYSFDQPRREGLVGLDQGSMFLPLRAGDNEVVLAITDVFGGWALLGRLEPPPGVTITGR